ncbi:hypothetical protein JRI60_30670 [Archangium violaceum]|uniref:hypothetical protein n=1 Tax=Archangium violaceum TaxID=83451 RepID=UPI001951E8F3|nr:hypothetical protein [Archangium violaceum]QRN93534.1 hypothetical protein JRI60_30670 [Archangium violaceum]
MSKNSPPDTAEVMAKVRAVAEQKWKESLAPKNANPADAAFIGWRTDISDPFPMTWPSVDGTLVFYALARGMNPQVLRDGEFVGPTWARITYSAQDKKAELTLLDVRLESRGVQGVRPLRQEELEILKSKPLDFLLGSRTAAADQKLKSYYCLQRSLGNIPSEAVTAHAAFFKWLDCGA